MSQALCCKECDNDGILSSPFCHHLSVSALLSDNFLFSVFYLYFLPRATYSDGKIKAPPKPCAGNQGTQITVGFCACSFLSLFCSLVVMLAPPIGICYIERHVTVSPCRIFSK